MVDFHPELSSRLDWWPKRCQIITYSMAAPFFSQAQPYSWARPCSRAPPYSRAPPCSRALEVMKPIWISNHRISMDLESIATTWISKSWNQHGYEHHRINGNTMQPLSFGLLFLRHGGLSASFALVVVFWWIVYIKRCVSAWDRFGFECKQIGW